MPEKAQQKEKCEKCSKKKHVLLRPKMEKFAKINFQKKKKNAKIRKNSLQKFVKIGEKM